MKNSLNSFLASQKPGHVGQELEHDYRADVQKHRLHTHVPGHVGQVFGTTIIVSMTYFLGEQMSEGQI